MYIGTEGCSAEGKGLEPSTPCGAPDFESGRSPIRIPSEPAPYNLTDIAAGKSPIPARKPDSDAGNCTFRLPVMCCRTPTSAIFGVLKQGFTTVAER